MAGRYKADRNADGTWNVRGVPVFASNRLRKVEVTKDWQERAVRKAAARFSLNGYTPPLHENHHGDGATVKRLGAWLPKRVVKIKTVEADEAGEPVVRESWATEADLLNLPDAEYQRVKRGDLPYVSVEANLAAEELESLAMLPTQAPAIKLPPVTIGTEEYAANVVAYAATGTTARTTMRFAAAMDEIKKPEDEKPEVKPDPVASPAVAAPAAKPEDAAPMAAKPDAATMDAKPDEAKMDKAEDAAEGETPGAPAKPVPATVAPAEVVPSWAASLSATVGALADLIAKALQPKQEQPVSMAQGAYKSAQTETFSAPPATPAAPAPVEAPAPTETTDKFASLAGELAVIKADLSARKADDDLREKVKPYAKRCAVKCPTDLTDDLFAMAKSGGLSAVEAYTAAVERFGVVAPPATFAAATSSAPEMPPELVAYQSKSPETFAAAKEANELYEAAPYLRGGQTRARWIENHLTAHKITK